ncbi:putative pseudouridine synthase TruD/Pus7 [Tothia fuscella]|uniref:Pseudouridine synthase TruD/Pus7 n=1 Tax=Tothia fuscella TaxID=1048955 RepID=A0A9P4NTV5_9PEZI|nr:putative pseudouridine synthase TruD/Pus7 [Tothia fuscella]
METPDIAVEPPAKRIRLSTPEQLKNDSSNGAGQNSKAKPQEEEEDTQLEKELKAGINAYINPATPGFSGTLKQRYTDFLVNEILPSGKVLHLQTIGAPVQKNGKKEEVKKEEKAVRVESKPVEQHAGKVAAKEDSVAKNGTPQKPVSKLSEEDRTELVEIFGEDVTASIIQFHEKILAEPDRKAKELGSIASNTIEDKDDRTKAHRAVRRIFNSTMETTTGDNNTIAISKAFVQNNKWGRVTAGAERAKGKLGWQELGGEYLHFTLYKENKDTMESIHFLATQLRFNIKNFQFAGTKDRRAVTVQRISTYRVHADKLAALNRNLRNAKIGDFKYENTGLALGDLLGNEFCITLRDCHFPGEDGLDMEARLANAKQLLSRAVSEVQESGFINYYGLQRFGSFSTGTHEVGTKLLQEDLEGAIKLILDYSPEILAAAQRPDGEVTNISSDDRNRALALHMWENKADLQDVLAKMPRKFSAESNIIRHLGREKKGLRISEKDWQGALSTIQRNMRLMYVHAYQSLVWNVAAGKRWELYGGKVVEGDLVLVGDKEEADGAPREEFDEDGDVIIQPGVDDSAATDGDFARARPLRKEEAESGKYVIEDIVLPLPGWDIKYPSNEVGAFYKEFMGSERGGRLDPHNMRRKWKDISLSGGYRKLIARPGTAMEWDVRVYRSVNEQLVKTDLERIYKASLKAKNGEEPKAEENDDEGEVAEEEKLAVVLKMQLGSSTYATMALRELMKAGGVKSYKADFGGGRGG